MMPNIGAPLHNDIKLLEAWNDATCRQSIIPLERMAAEDLALVKDQKASRADRMVN
jgi:hypothetical protein